MLINGPVEQTADFKPAPLLEGAGIVLLVGLVGWMPAGMEASTMNSIWVVEKMRSNNYRPSLKEGLFDFNLGYIFTTVLAVMFLIIGTFTVFGSGQLLEGSATKFSNSLIQVFSANLGAWSFWIIAIAAFGTIYGTLITILDAFTRSFVRCMWEINFKSEKENQKYETLHKNYKIVLPLLATGGFLLFYLSASSMIKMLEFATIISFITAPIIGILNLIAIRSRDVPTEYYPKFKLISLAYLGIAANVGFALFYLVYVLF